ncbi:hypothetical protein L6452_28128 [Arctium lappa]|uniref:Uncharacterized protein n=1 Tax=Arctium lappa TaxID=4217 RepID=A0ACB8ZYD9_ARCLA|nr:hypothetical protein L6452_28128 [Arctium lappa]
MGSLKEERKITGWAAKDPSGILSPYTFTLRHSLSLSLSIHMYLPPKNREDDVLIKFICCGVCHTDLHQIKNDYGTSNYPMVSGHEVVGEVKEVGSDVSKFKVGDTVGVRLLVGCCNSCRPCQAEAEQYCKKKKWAYNDVYTDRKPTQSGFSDSMVIHQK